MKNKESILKKISELIDKYNSIDGVDKLSLVHDEIFDTRNLYVCLYDDKVGLFKKENYQRKLRDYLIDYDIYYGIDTNNITAHLKHMLKNSCDRWYDKGELIGLDDNKIISTCIINEEFHIENVRLEMYNEGRLDNYQVGVIASKEILEILSYVYIKNNERSKEKTLK